MLLKNPRLRMGGIVLSALAVAASAITLSGCAGKKQSSEPVVGVFLALTGPQADFGLTTRSGIELAVKEINAAGGVNGQKIKLAIEDNRGDSGETRTVVTKLIQNTGVIALLGDVASSNSLAAAPIAQQNKIPMISPSSTNPDVTKAGDYIFRVCFIDPFQGYVMAKFAADNLKAKKAAILWDTNQDYSKGLSTVFKKEFPKLGGTVVEEITYGSGEVDFSSQLTKIRTSNPDVIFVPGYYSEVALIARKARELGIKAPLLGGDGWTSPNLIKNAGTALEGSYFSNHYSEESDSAVVKKFIKNYKEKFGKEPNSLAALGYDAMWILAESYRKAGSFDAAKVRDEIAKTSEYPGVTGQITINEERNAVKPAVVLKIEGDKFKYFTTIDPPK